MKVARKSISTEPERASLARLQFEPLRDQTARFWNDEVSPWAELKTPEPELNAFHKAHLAHQMISDHRMPGEDGLISTSVGADAYGNYGNESTMVIQELEERGLHEDARKRLALWLKYQGTAKLAGRFSEQEGVFLRLGRHRGRRILCPEPRLDHVGTRRTLLHDPRQGVVGRDRAEFDSRCGMDHAPAPAHHG